VLAVLVLPALALIPPAPFLPAPLLRAPFLRAALSRAEDGSSPLGPELRRLDDLESLVTKLWVADAAVTNRVTGAHTADPADPADLTRREIGSVLQGPARDNGRNSSGPATSRTSARC